MMDEYRLGLWRGRLQTGVVFTTVASLLSISFLIKLVTSAPTEPETRTGYFNALNKDVNGDGIRDWSFELYNARGEPVWGKKFLGRRDGSYTSPKDPNCPYIGDPNNQPKRQGLRDKLV